MKVILVKDTAGLGEEGDVRDVAKGYARNYLFPQGFAVEENTFNRNRMKEQHKKIEQRKIKKREDAQSIADALSGLNLTITAAAADNQKLFGAVHENDIKKALEKMGYEIDKKSIQLAGPIKTTGTYRVPVRVYENIQAELTVQVNREGGEAPAGQPPAEQPVERELPAGQAEPRPEEQPGADQEQRQEEQPEEHPEEQLETDREERPVTPGPEETQPAGE